MTVEELESRYSESIENLQKKLSMTEAELKASREANFLLKEMLLKIMEDTDVCILCKMKGQVLPECKIRENDKACLSHILELWGIK